MKTIYRRRFKKKHDWNRLGFEFGSEVKNTTGKIRIFGGKKKR